MASSSSLFNRIFSPSIISSPLVGLISVPIIFNNVVFPLPLSPTIEMNLGSVISKSTLFNALCDVFPFSYIFVIFFNSIIILPMLTL